MIRARTTVVVFWGYAITWTALLLVPDPDRVFFLPAGTSDSFAQSSVYLDKVVHASGYFFFMLSAAAAFHSASAGIGIAWLLAGGAAHAALTELTQLAVPPREGHWGDFVANVVGLGVGALVWRLVRRSAPSRDGTEQKVQP